MAVKVQSATIHMLPSAVSRGIALQQIANAITRIDELWLISELQLGASPPASCRALRSPYGRPLRWVQHHGPAAAATREYYAAPVLFGLRSGTCVDLACYDAAAMRVLEGRSVFPLVHEIGAGKFHVLLIENRDGQPQRVWDHIANTYGRE